MKKKSLGELLKKLEESQIQNSTNITDLTDLLSKKMLKGGYNTSNGSCGGSNDSCSNQTCPGSTNNYCWNTSCII